MEAMKISKRKGGDSGCHPTAPDELVMQCSSAVLDDGGVQGEHITPPACTPWTYSNAYGCAACFANLASGFDSGIPPRVVGRFHIVALRILWWGNNPEIEAHINRKTCPTDTKSRGTSIAVLSTVIPNGKDAGPVLFCLSVVSLLRV